MTPAQWPEQKRRKHDNAGALMSGIQVGRESMYQQHVSSFTTELAYCGGIRKVGSPPLELLPPNSTERRPGMALLIIPSSCSGLHL